MTDNKKRLGKSDRIRAAGKQQYEVYYVARKFGVTADRVRQVIKCVGNLRKRVYETLARD